MLASLELHKRHPLIEPPQWSFPLERGRETSGGNSVSRPLHTPFPRTDKKENEIFLIYKEINMGSVAKSYMRKGFLIYEEMRKYLTKYEEEAVSCI